MTKVRGIGGFAQMSLVLLTAGGLARADGGNGQGSGGVAFYSNPPVILIPSGGQQTNCADPTVIRGQAGDPNWYAFCTTDSLNDEDVDASGARRSHLVPMLRSSDLVSWVYMGDAFAARPSWVAPGAGLWAPDVVFRNGKYYLYYTATDVADAVSGEPGCNSDNAIGVATSTSPLGPWIDAGAPVVPPRRGGGGCNFLWTYDPDVLVTSAGQPYLYYGSYYGGIEVRTLSDDGLSSDPASAAAITIPNRYEASNVVEKDGAFWLFASASNCCNGPLTGYQVFVGKASSPLGPFTDREGVSLLDARVGGSPVITQSGNRWVGPGHNSVFQDAIGNWFTAYHAVDQTDPYFANATGYTRRPMLVDRLTWNDGWPQVRQDLGASDSPELAPLAQAPQDPRIAKARAAIYNLYLDAQDPNAWLLALDRLNVAELTAIPSATDDFSGTTLDPRWTWVRPPPATDFGVANGVLSFATEAADLFQGSNNASVLTEAAPTGNYLAEVKVDLDLPDEGCCQNFVQAGLVAYANDDTYLKLTHTSIWETRQIEFAKEIPSPAPGFPAYGTSVGGPPARTTWLRIAKVAGPTDDRYVSYSSIDGVTFTRGAVWSHQLGANAKLGLVAFGGTGFTARFDAIRVWSLPACLSRTN